MFDRLDLLMIAIPAAPLVAAALAIALSLVARPLRDYSHWPVVLALAFSCFCSFMVLGHVLGAQNAPNAPPTFEYTTTLWTWVNIPNAYYLNGEWVNLVIDVTLRADALTAMMLCMVTFISTLVCIYASGYMENDAGYGRFFAYFGLFVFSMTMLVSVSNFLLLFVFWEAVGMCSYLLIGYWFEKPEAADAGKKAFLVNRVGDFGFTLAMFLIWTTYGTLNFHDTPVLTPAQTEAARAAQGPNQTKIVEGVLGKSRLDYSLNKANPSADATSQPSGPPLGYVGGAVGLAICLLLMVGACGKSAQFPLHVWLPDAMEGPTPVSALIHAATMVTAGVYMVTRCTPLFMVSPESQLVVSTIGGFTALMAGLIAVTQFDLKRVLAYSTVSQLGYMFLALGTGLVGGIGAGMFHLLTHAFFKALLFLGAGSVMHAMGGVIDMRRFSGLRNLMPWTCGTFLIGSLALAGVFPLSGFWSKDAILGAVHDKAHDYAHAYENSLPHDISGPAHAPAHDAGHEPPGGGDRLKLLDGLTLNQLLWYGRIYNGLYLLGLFTALLTAFYTFRAFFMTFYGEEKIPHEAGHHAHESPPVMTVPLVVLAVCAVVAGMVLTPFLTAYLKHTPSLGDGPAALDKVVPGMHLDVAFFSTVAAGLGIAAAAYLYLGHTREVQWLRGFFDLEGMRNSWAGAWVVSPYQLSLNKFYFDEIYQVLFVMPAMILSSICYWLDRYLVDGLVNLVGSVPPAAGNVTRRSQTGLVPWYALAMAVGVVALIVAKSFGAF